MTDFERDQPKRAYTRLAPDRSIAPVYVRRGFYLPLSDYARRAGVARLTAYNRLRRGEIEGVRVGIKTILIRVKK